MFTIHFGVPPIFGNTHVEKPCPSRSAAFFGSFFSTTQRSPRFLKDEIPGLVEQGYEGDVPSMKVPRFQTSPKNIRDKNPEAKTILEGKQPPVRRLTK